MDNQPFWEGVEVEGQHRGKRTLFLYSRSPDLALVNLLDYEHIWVCQHYWTEKPGGWSMVYYALLHDIPVTLEVMMPIQPIPDNIREKCELVYTLDLTGQIAPKISDTIRVIEAPYNVRTIRYGSMYPAEPDDYQGDKIPDVRNHD